MGIHSYSKCWIHIVWGTKGRNKIISKEGASKISEFLQNYTKEKGIYHKINYVNADHVHILIELPTNLCIEEIAKLLKGSSSYWINKEKIVTGKLTWSRGYGAFSVSQSQLEKVKDYIYNQEEHHKVKTFKEEYREFIEAYGMKYVDYEEIEE